MFYWFKSLHLIFMVTWFAGLFYLPRLFVYHSMSTDPISIDRFKIMERKLFYGIMTPGAILTLIFGVGIVLVNGWDNYKDAPWMHIKLAAVLLLIGYHIYCGILLTGFKHDNNRHGHVWYRWFNEIPVLLLFVIVIMAVLRPL